MAQNIDEMMQETPVLTFEPFGQEKKEVEVKPEPEQVVLTPEEERQVADFASRIDLTSSNMILQYLSLIHI